MTLYEIARRLYRPGWADEAEFIEALDALQRLSQDAVEAVLAIGLGDGDR